MKPTLHPVLSSRNSHPRDADIQFFEEDHKYIILSEPDVKYTSVTTWNHSHFPKFEADSIIDNMMKSKSWKEGHKYWGLTPEQIKAQWNTNKDAVAGAGTDLHYEIECFNNDKRFQFDYTNKELYEIYMSDNKMTHDSKAIEWQYFINFVRDFPDLKPYRTEWTVYHDDVTEHFQFMTGSVPNLLRELIISINSHSRHKFAIYLTPISGTMRYNLTHIKLLLNKNMAKLLKIYS